jgi:hypothetical protein
VQETKKDRKRRKREKVERKVKEDEEKTRRGEPEKGEKKQGTESTPILVTPTSCDTNFVHNTSIERAANCAPSIPIEHNPIVCDRTCIVTIDKPALISTPNPSILPIETPPNAHINTFKGDTFTNPDPTTSTEPIAFFCSNQHEGEGLQEFLRAFCNDMCACLASDDQEIANVFVDYLGADSTADFWYDNLPQATQNSWDKLKDAFVQQWPE